MDITVYLVFDDDKTCYDCPMGFNEIFGTYEEAMHYVNTRKNSGVDYSIEPHTVWVPPRLTE